MNHEADAKKGGAETLVNVLERMREGMRQLAALLREEAEAVESRDLEGLQRRLDAKRHLIGALESHIARLQHEIESAGFNFSAAGIVDFIQAHDPSGLMLGRWRDLIEETRGCERLNRELARLIERQQRRVALGLSLLLGSEAATTTYDPRGRPVAGGQPGRSLDQA